MYTKLSSLPVSFYPFSPILYVCLAYLLIIAHPSFPSLCLHCLFIYHCLSILASSLPAMPICLLLLTHPCLLFACPACLCFITAHPSMSPLCLSCLSLFYHCSPILNCPLCACPGCLSLSLLIHNCRLCLFLFITAHTAMCLLCVCSAC